MKLWDYSRVSTEEKGQDVEAQKTNNRQRTVELGHEVVGGSTDKCSGEVAPEERPGWQEALEAVQSCRAEGIVLRHPNRFSRQEPEVALAAWNKLQASGLMVLCLEDQTFTTLGGLRPDQEPPTVRLVRYISFWEGWRYLMESKKGTARTMADFREGRRVPKAPVGRPEAAMDVAALDAARRHLAGGGTIRGAHHVYNKTATAGLVSEEAIRARERSRHTVAKALGWSGTGNNSNRSKTGVGQEGVSPVANGPDDDQGGPAASGASDAGVGA